MCSHLRPVLLDFFFVLCDLGDTAIACPIASFVVAETDVDVIVVCNFMEFARGIISDEDERELVVLESCVNDVSLQSPLYVKKKSLRWDGFIARACIWPSADLVVSMAVLVAFTIS